jgi:secreted PhoX family phosphatase
MTISRRKVLRMGAGAIGLSVAAPLMSFYSKAAQGKAKLIGGYGALVPKLPVNAGELADTVVGDLSREAILALPPGFNYRVLSMTGMPMSDGTRVPAGHDGMAAFRGPGNTTILVRNHELSTSLPSNYNFGVAGSPRYSSTALGGTTTIVVGPNREVVRDFVSIAGTRTNCAGGPTPWNSWITCEETFSTTNVKHGYCFDVPADATGPVQPVPLTAMGRFSHEAIAVDPRTGYIYETEDRGDSCFYRFVPTVNGQPARGGSLYAMKIVGGAQNTTNNPTQGGTPGAYKVGDSYPVEWVLIDNPDPTTEGTTVNPTTIANGTASVRRQGQAKGAAIFFRGEGCWYGNELVYFVATQSGPPAAANLPSPPGNGRGNGQVWAYDPRSEMVTLVVEAGSTGDLLDEPDNVVVTPWGDLLLCEDSSDDFQYLVGVNREGDLYQFAKNVLFSQVTDDPAKANFIGNEFAGACFDPDGRTLYVNVQTPGMTFAIWGPWTSNRG